MTRDGKLDTLKEAMIDVSNGTYQASKEARLATGRLEFDLTPENSQADILVRDTPVIDENTTLTSVIDGAQIALKVPEKS